MSLYLVRHAKAGSRSEWDGDDVVRPLSKSGWKQSKAIAKYLRKLQPTQLLSSPYLRCRQTLEPLGTLLDLEVVDDARLTEGEPFEGVLDLIAQARDGTVMCSHGDLIPETIAALHRRGCSILTPPDWRKATVWKLDLDDDGQVATASLWGPPAT
jgi:8-oxo-dGTP diphosphatase